MLILANLHPSCRKGLEREVIGAEEPEQLLILCHSQPLLPFEFQPLGCLCPVLGPFINHLPPLLTWPDGPNGVAMTMDVHFTAIEGLND